MKCSRVLKIGIFLSVAALTACNDGQSGGGKKATTQNSRLAGDTSIGTQLPAANDNSKAQKSTTTDKASKTTPARGDDRPEYKVRTREDVKPGTDPKSSTSTKATSSDSSVVVISTTVAGSGSASAGSSEAPYIEPPVQSSTRTKKTSGEKAPYIEPPKQSEAASDSSTYIEPPQGAKHASTNVGWAADHKPVKAGEQMITGGADRSLQLYTDLKPDGLMALAVEKANALPKDIFESSREFAEMIQHVSMDFHPLKQTVEMDIHIANGDGTTMFTRYAGYIPENRVTDLRQVKLPWEKKKHKFSVRLYCLDRDNKECTSSIIQVTQTYNGNPCNNTAYIVYRQSQMTTAKWAQTEIGDGLVIASEYVYQNGGKGATATYRAFSRLISNTIQSYRVKRGLIRNEEMKSPRFEEISARSWAVAYGPSQFELYFQKLDERTEHTRVIYKFLGPLVHSQESVPKVAELGFVQLNYGLPEVTAEFNENLEAASFSGILKGNDGAGNLSMRLEFHENSLTEPLEFNFSALSVRPILDLGSIQQLVQ